MTYDKFDWILWYIVTTILTSLVLKWIWLETERKPCMTLKSDSYIFNYKEEDLEEGQSQKEEVKYPWMRPC